MTDRAGIPQVNTLGGHGIRSLAHDLFGNADRISIREAIKSFCSNGSLTTFVFEIGEVIKTAEQMMFIAALREFLPKELQANFTALCRMNIRGYKDFLKGKPLDTSRKSTRTPKDIYSTSYKTSRRPAIPKAFLTLPNFGAPSSSLPLSVIPSGSEQRYSRPCGSEQRYSSPSEAEQRYSSPSEAEQRCSSPIERLDSQGESQDYEAGDTVRTVTSVIRFRPAKSTPKRAAGRSRSTMPSSVHRSPKKHLKRVLFERRKGESLGLNIKGGKEYKCGIFISAVDQGRQAERKGLCIGDRIIRVNGISFVKISHHAAVHILSQPMAFDVIIDTSAREHVRTTHSEVSEARCDPRLVQNWPSNTRRLNSLSELGNEEPSNTKTRTRTIDVQTDSDGYLGCSIRGGKDIERQVVISHVDRGSPAHVSGLRSGDCVIQINDVEVKEMNHLDIVMLAAATGDLKFVVQRQQKDKKDTANRNNETTPYNIRRAFTDTLPADRHDYQDRDRPMADDDPPDNTHAEATHDSSYSASDEIMAALVDGSVSAHTAEDGYLTETSNSCNLQVVSRPSSRQLGISQTLSLASTSQADLVFVPEASNEPAETAPLGVAAVEATSSYVSDFEVNIVSSGVVTSTPRQNVQFPQPVQRKLSNKNDNGDSYVKVNDIVNALTLSRRLRTPRVPARPTEKPPPPPSSQTTQDSAPDPYLSHYQNTEISPPNLAPHTSDGNTSQPVLATSPYKRSHKEQSSKSRPSTIRMNLLNAPELYSDETDKHSQCTDKQISTLTTSGLFEVLI